MNDHVVDAGTAQSEPLKPLRVLVIEDDHEYASFLQWGLSEKGCEVTRVDTHDKARRLLLRGERYDMVFCDGSTDRGSNYTAGAFLDDNAGLDKPMPIITMSGDDTYNIKMVSEAGDMAVRCSKNELFESTFSGYLQSANETVLANVIKEAQQRGTGRQPG